MILVHKAFACTCRSKKLGKEADLWSAICMYRFPLFNSLSAHTIESIARRSGCDLEEEVGKK